MVYYSLDGVFKNECKITKKRQLYIKPNSITLSHWKMESIINNLSSYWKYQFKNLKKKWFL